jgi:hypothetical protein
MPKIKIFRKKDWFIRYRVFEIYSNGQRIGYLSNGETEEFDVPSGEHKLKVKMGHFSSRNLNCNMYNKETKSFTVSRNQIMVMIIVILLLLTTLMETYFRHTFEIERRVFEIITFLIFFFFHSFGTHLQFLNIKEN